MLTAVVLICSLANTPNLRHCTIENAVDLLAVPGEFRTPYHCLRDAEAFFAKTYPLETLEAHMRLKVLCRRPQAPKNVG
jgi:hypothetical protein